MNSAFSPALLASRAASGIRRLLLAALLAAVTISGVVLAAPTAALAEDTIGISGQPAGADGAPDGRTRFSYAADPGQQLSDQYLVSNAGSLPQTFTILATDAFNDDAGDFALKPTEEAPTDLGSWVRFENGDSRIQLELQPGESRLVPFTVAVPDNAAPGDHSGGVVASVVTPEAQVKIDRRLGTRMYVRVSGEIQTGLAVGKLTGDYSGEWWNPLTGTLKLSYTVENIGNIALASNVSIGANTWFGIPLSTQVGDAIPELLPGGTRTYETTVPGIAAWGYLNPWVKLNPFVEGDDATKRLQVQATTRDAVVVAMPWTVLILLALVALFIGFRFWRRKVDAQRAAAWIEYTEAEALRKATAERASGADPLVTSSTGSLASRGGTDERQA
ncbi:hypothetical protein ACSHWG_05700 [Leucobacter sp. Z1108]|uniref:hypothetical protein n=1 Tax=Leucobacter sp. Z1108 TaxID=3439066 RepID=UPI003F2BC938